MYSAPAQAADPECSATYDAGKRYCIPPIVTEWQWTATFGVYKWGPFATEAEAVSAGIAGRKAIYTAAPSTGCDLVYANTARDITVGYDAGFDVTRSHGVRGDFTGYSDENPPCSRTTTLSALDLVQRRKVRCPARPPGEYQFGLFADLNNSANTVCAIPWTRARKTPCDSCQPTKGNPGEVFTGVKTESKTDYAAGGSSPLRFQRFYRSDAARSNVLYSTFAVDSLQPLGIGWSAMYFQRITLNSSGANPTAIVLRPDGTEILFRFDGSAFLPDDDISMRLIKLVDGGGAHTGWELKDRGDNVETYDAAGRLLTIRDRSGLTHTVSYSSAAFRSPSNVQDDFGHTLAFSYDSNLPYPRVSTMTLPDSTQVTYAYDAKGNLTTVTTADATVLTYHYELDTSGGQQQSLLTGVTTENSIRYSTFTYSGFQIASSEHAGGVGRYTFNFSQLMSSGRTTVTDPLNVSRQYVSAVVAGTRRLTSAPSTCAGCSEPKSQTFDTDGNVTARRDFNNNLTCYAYDTARNLETVRVEGFASSVASCPANLATYTPASGARERKIETGWHSTIRVPTSITETNRTTSFTHDGNGNILTRTVTDTAASPNVSRTWTYTYNSYGQVLTEDGPRTDVSDVTTYTYYTCTSGFQCGQLYTVTNALSHTTTYNSCNAHGQPTQITDANGLVTSLAYDARQRMTDRCVGGTLPSCAGGELTHLDYWPTGLLKKVTSPDGSYIEYTYDAAHRLTQINDGANNKVVYTLDATGNRTAENTYDPSNALRRTHSRVFNTLNQLWKDVNAAGTAAVTTTFGYDTNGNLTTTNAPLSRNSTSLYDEINRLKQITDPAFGVTQFGYDANDNLTSVTDPRSLVTSYTYSGFGDLKTQTSPDTGVTTNTYDSGGNLDTSTDSRRAVTGYAYDALNRVASASFTLGGVTDQTLTYAYDTGTNQLGRLTSASDADHSLSWTYDSHGRVTGKGQTVGGVTLATGYGSNAAGQLASTLLPSGATVTYGYNANGQVTSLTLNGSTTILSGITYDPFGPVTGWTWGNGTTASRGFDADGKVTQVDNANGVSLKTYAYDDAFRITGIADALDPALSWTYGYDALDRLTAANRTGLTQGWTYDANGNRLTETGTTPSTYSNSGSSNRVSSIAGSLPRSYGYDAAGNTLGYASATFTYNNRGRMATAANGGVTATYTYNALGQRVRRATSSATTLYVYDEAGHLTGEYSATGSLIQETVWLGDTPVATLRPNGSGGVDIYYVHADHLNTPRLVTDTVNDVRWRWESDPFGTNLPDQNPGSLGVFEYNLRFPGQQFDGIVGLHYNYFRDYDPAVGRYVEPDPAGLVGGMSLYSYVLQSPVNYFDANGLLPLQGSIDCYFLRKAVVSACKVSKRRCNSGDLCPELRRKAFLFLTCYIAQLEYTRRCFPTDPTHQGRLTAELNGAQECARLHKIHCAAGNCLP